MCDSSTNLLSALLQERFTHALHIYSIWWCSGYWLGTLASLMFCGRPEECGATLGNYTQ